MLSCCYLVQKHWESSSLPIHVNMAFPLTEGTSNCMWGFANSQSKSVSKFQNDLAKQWLPFHPAPRRHVDIQRTEVSCLPAKRHSVKFDRDNTVWAGMHPTHSCPWSKIEFLEVTHCPRAFLLPFTCKGQFWGRFKSHAIFLSCTNVVCTNVHSENRFLPSENKKKPFHTELAGDTTHNQQHTSTRISATYTLKEGYQIDVARNWKNNKTTTNEYRGTTDATITSTSRHWPNLSQIHTQNQRCSRYRQSWSMYLHTYPPACMRYPRFPSTDLVWDQKRQEWIELSSAGFL